MINWKTEERPIKALKKHPKNPRQLSKDQHYHLKTSLEKFGLIDKIIINLDNTIIGGHQRLKILKELGYTKVDCSVPDRQLDEQEIDELCVRLNKNTGAWDFDELANTWEADDLLAWGFNEAELIGAFSEVEEAAAGAESKKKGGKTKSCPSCGFEL
jgi:ParB-like chromosome segregation protein Spo0J